MQNAMTRQQQEEATHTNILLMYNPFNTCTVSIPHPHTYNPFNTTTTCIYYVDRPVEHVT